MHHCFHCKSKVSIGDKPSRNETCTNCGKDLKVCRNCRFYNLSSTNQCSEPMAELVPDKEKANFCEYFFFADTVRPRKRIHEDPLQGLKSLFTDCK